jgi:hypothetical protein
VAVLHTVSTHAELPSHPPTHPHTLLAQAKVWFAKRDFATCLIPEQCQNTLPKSLGSTWGELLHGTHPGP